MVTVIDLRSRPDEEARQILRQRKKRTRTSCYPCRTRKVKCDKSSPCENCIKRGYPELCSFTGGDASAGSGRTVCQVSRGPPASPATQRDQLQSDSLSDTTPRYRNSLGFNVQSVYPGDTPLGEPPPSIRANQENESQAARNSGDQNQREPFLGSNSMPAFLREHASQDGSAQNTPDHSVEDAILPILGLGESTSTSSFLLAPPTRLQTFDFELSEGLPTDHELISLFRCYRLHSHSFSPIILDIDGFELELCAYVEYRARAKRSAAPLRDSQEPKVWKSVSWLSSLFALLASGAQYSDLPSEEREAKSQRYVRYSFQCLRVANFLIRPSLLCIQTLLILGIVLQGDMKPEAAWILLGTTARMAQSLGLHNEKTHTTPQRRALWLSVIWQDSLLSLCFDRPPVTASARLVLQPLGHFSYRNAMNALCVEIINLISSRTHNESADYARILETVTRIEDIHRDVVGHYADCSSIAQRCESCTLNLHISFVIAWICRPALRNLRSTHSRTDLQLQLIQKCNKNLLECTRAFVQLHAWSILASRSWPVIHNGLSSTLLLALLGGTGNNPEVHELQGEVLNILSTESAGEDIRTVPDNKIRLSPPHTRAIAVLKRLYNEQANKSAQDVATGGSRPYQEVVGETSQFMTHSASSPRARVSENPDSFDSINAGELQPSDYMSDQLDIFDSIIWDPTGVGATFPEYDVSSYEPWPMSYGNNVQ